MFTPLKRYRPALDPLGAVVFLTLWIVAEAGRYHPGFYVVLTIYAIAIGLTTALPWVSLSIIFVVPPLQLIGLLDRPEATTWPIAGASVIVAFLIGLSATGLVRWIGLGVVLVQALVIGFTLVYAADWVDWTGGGELALSPSDYAKLAIFVSAIGAILCGAAWVVGFATSVSTKRRKEKKILDQTEAELVMAGFELRSVKERNVIAQEVHDVLAHSLAVIIAVADGSRFLRQAKPETTDKALREIADTARSALIDLRGLIEGLRDDSASRPQPALSDLTRLTERLSTAGMRVETQSFGVPQPLTMSQELAIYRIVQESLTNALKHSGRHPSAVVSFNWEGRGLALTIASTGEGTEPPESPAEVPHYGVTNMKDRARLAGGWLAAGLDDEGDPTYLVTAYIPTAGLAEGETDDDDSPSHREAVV